AGFAHEIETPLQSVPIISAAVAGPKRIRQQRRRLALTLDGGVTGHAQGDDNVNLMRLLGLIDLPSATALGGDRAADCQTHAGIGIDSEAAALNQLVKILAGSSEVWRRL